MSRLARIVTRLATFGGGINPPSAASVSQVWLILSSIPPRSSLSRRADSPPSGISTDTHGTTQTYNRP